MVKYHQRKAVINMEDTFLTDEQFETYNKLLQLVDNLILEIPPEKQEEYKKQKEDILLKK